MEHKNDVMKDDIKGDIKGDIKRKPWNRWFWLLLLPFIGTLWVPFFNSFTPTIWGIPFFYFYQMAWIPLSAFITGLVYYLVESESKR